MQRAVVTGQMRSGDAFPSVRTLSVALKINPNTAHKIVATLTEEGLLVVRPGIGTVVGEQRAGGAAARRVLLEQDAERLAIRGASAWDDPARPVDGDPPSLDKRRQTTARRRRDGPRD